MVLAPSFGGFGSSFGAKPFGTTVTTASPFNLTTPFAQGENSSILFIYYEYSLG